MLRRMTRNPGKTTWLLGGAFAALCCALPLLVLGGLVSIPSFTKRSAPATATPWSGIDESRVRLIAAATGLGEGEAINLGLEITLAPGFKTYWRGAAYGGFPPRIDFSESENVAEARVLWPTPQRFQLHGIDVVGYEDSVLFPIEIVPARPETLVRARANVAYLACSTICIPIDAALALDLNNGAAAATAHAGAIDKALMRVPSQDAGDLSVERVVAGGSAEEPLLNVSIRSADAPIVDPDVLIEYSDEISFSRPSVRLSPDRRAAILTVGMQNFIGDPVAEDLSEKTVVVTVMDGRRAVEAVRQIQ